MTWISSTETEKWCENNTFSEQPGKEIKIGKEIGKPIYGFGCCISEICAKAILSLEPEKKDAVFQELFDPKKSAYTFCRLSIGANDFAESWYSYNEHEGDYAMKYFSIDRDQKYIIPAIREAQKYAKDITFFASPWSPPTWMKFPKVYNYGQMVMTDENLRAYALYLKKYLESYKKENINIVQLHVQNEIFADQKFPSCVWTGEQLRRFIADYLIDAIGDMAQIWFGTVNGPEDIPDDISGHTLVTRHNQFLNYVMQDPKCAAAIKGASYQWAGKFGITQAKEDYPELDTINSECECGDGRNTWRYAMYTYEMLHHYFRHGARANVYWNMALEPGGLSTWGWNQNSLITVNNGDYTFNPDFYCIKHFSHFVKPGAIMLETAGNFSSNTTVFRNPDGGIVAVIQNPFDTEKVISLCNKNYVLKPYSFNTITV